MTTLLLLLGIAVGVAAGFKFGRDKGRKQGLSNSYIIIEVQDAYDMAKDLRKSVKDGKIDPKKDVVLMDRDEWRVIGQDD